MGAGSLVSLLQIKLEQAYTHFAVGHRQNKRIGVWASSIYRTEFALHPLLARGSLGTSLFSPYLLFPSLCLRGCGQEFTTIPVVGWYRTPGVAPKSRSFGTRGMGRCSFRRHLATTGDGRSHNHDEEKTPIPRTGLHLLLCAGQSNIQCSR